MIEQVEIGVFEINVEGKEGHTWARIGGSRGQALRLEKELQDIVDGKDNELDMRCNYAIVGFFAGIVAVVVAALLWCHA
jgi:hypothetical protein